MRVLMLAILAATAVASACGSEQEAPPISSTGPETPARDSTPAVAGARATPTPSPVLRAIPSRIIIEKIGVDAPVVTLGLDPNGVPYSPRDATDVAWLDFSARPGSGSNAIFAGNAHWDGPAVLYELEGLEPADSITVVGQDGTGLIYSVADLQTLDLNDPAAIKVMEPTEEDVITLITEAGVYDGTQWSLRLVVRGRLVGVVTGLNPMPLPPAPPTSAPPIADLEVTGVMLNATSSGSGKIALDFALGIRNNGPGAAAIAVSPVYTVPPDCILSAGGGAMGTGPMPASTDLGLSASQLVTCSGAGIHLISVTVSVALSEGGVTDPNPDNNRGQATSEVNISPQ